MSSLGPHIIVLLLLVAGFAFWIWMLIDCAAKEPTAGNDKIAWILILVLTQFIGALIYYFVRRRPRLFSESQVVPQHQ